jgi:hypothetical protein
MKGKNDGDQEGRIHGSLSGEPEPEDKVHPVSG